MKNKIKKKNLLKKKIFDWEKFSLSFHSIFCRIVILNQFIIFETHKTMSLIEFVEFHCDFRNVLNNHKLEDWVIYGYKVHSIKFWKFVFQMKPLNDLNLFKSIL